MEVNNYYNPIYSWAVTEAQTDLWTIVIPLISVLIAALALALTWHQVKKQQEHMKLMCEPYLIAEVTLDPVRKIYSYLIKNKGIGPAIITEVEFIINNKKIQSSNIIHDFVQDAFQGVKFDSFDYSALHPGNYLSVNESQPLFSINTHEDHPPMSLEGILQKKARIVIKYKSVYNSKHTLDPIATPQPSSTQ